MVSSILTGDVRECLRGIPDGSVHCVVTSPPYWGLRDYQTPPQVWGGGSLCAHEWGENIERKGGAGNAPDKPSGFQQKSAAGAGGALAQMKTSSVSSGRFCRKCNAWLGDLGLEPTVELYVDHMVEVFREVRRVLRDDGTLWLNMGDCYAGAGYSNHDINGPEWKKAMTGDKRASRQQDMKRANPDLKPKDLLGQPWRVAFALQTDGWYLRSDIIWAKPNPMPESCRDRPTKSHEYVFMLTKRPRYFFDQEAVRENSYRPDLVGRALRNIGPTLKTQGRDGDTVGNLRNDNDRQGVQYCNPSGRNIRSVWTIATQPFPEAHFATFPEALPERCIRAGTSERGCCPACGAPWVRVVKKTRTVDGDAVSLPRIKNSSISAPSGAQGVGHGRIATVSETTGWEPSCDCQNEDAVQAWDDSAAVALAPPFDPVPCTVLDPFVGSGTTALVAVRLGRSVVGIDLSEKYTDMIRKQLAVVSEGDARRPRKVRVKRRRFKRAKNA